MKFELLRPTGLGPTPDGRQRSIARGREVKRDRSASGTLLGKSRTGALRVEQSGDTDMPKHQMLCKRRRTCLRAEKKVFLKMIN